jgi:hypothetical protein
MAQAPLENVVTHWHKLFENLQTSAMDFYAAVELGLNSRKIPGLKISRVKWSEGGVLSPDREYLRAEGDRHAFDMCAAPFGAGYFFSSWLTEKQPRFVILKAALLIVFTAALYEACFLSLIVVPSRIGAPFGAVIIGSRLVIQLMAAVLASLVTLWLVAVAARNGNNGLEPAVLALPAVGWFYKKVFAQQTYYRIDTMLMFQSAVHSAMLEAIDGQTTQKGVRGLTDDERKPVFRKLI